jgi:hypothetical protein
MARDDALRRVALAARNAEVLAVMVDEIPTRGLTLDKADTARGPT